MGRPPFVLVAPGRRFVYFNNDWEGYAIENALYLKRRLGQEAQADADLVAFANAAAAQG